jgi:hypothetical protein
MSAVRVEIGTTTRSRAGNFGIICVAGMLAAVLGSTWGCGGIVSGSSTTKTATPPQTYGISGTLSPATGGAGASVTLSGASSGTGTADASGAYSFTGLANGAYVITPGHAGYSFTPATQGVIVNGADVTGVNFAAAAQSQTFSISGMITPTTGGAGATITLSGAAANSTMTDGAGNFSLAGLSNGAYIVTPSNTGFAFSPVSQSVTISGANVTGVSFTAAPQSAHSVSLTWSASPTTTVTGYNVYRSTVSGSLYAKVNSAALTGLAYTDTAVQTATTYYYVATAVDGNGNESVFSNQVTAAIP